MSTSDTMGTFVAGKVLVISFRGYDFHAAIENPRIETVFDRRFVVGVVPKGVLRGFEGKELAVDWEHVEQFYIVDSADEYTKCFSEWKQCVSNRPFYRWWSGKS